MILQYKKLNNIIENTLKKKSSTIRRINQGFYGYIFLVGEKSKFIAKVYKKEGYLDYERAQLEELKKYALVHTPEILGISYKKDNGFFDVLFMEYIEGVNCTEISITDSYEKNRLGNEIIENLLSIHQVSNPNGFGDFVLNKYDNDWAQCYKRCVDKYYGDLIGRNRFRISSNNLKIAEMLYNSFDDVFNNNKVEKNSLIHGDYNLWNLLVDPNTHRLIGMIDPMGCSYADRELDLFQLENANGNDFDLLYRYSKQVQLSENFQLKNAYYHFWDDIKHYVNTGYCDNKLFRLYGKKALDYLNL